MPQSVVIGLDVGSTTVKAVAIDAATRLVLWRDYQRHHTKQAEKAIALLAALEDAVPYASSARIFATGSGAQPLCAPLGARFVHEVSAVTLAVEELHPDAASVIELGGQDAKIIAFHRDPNGARTAAPSMNDKCASGTGATIDKCLLKVGMAPELVGAIRFDAGKLHHVAAKCGVFAETDIVNLVKAGIPAAEILCSLADAIVHQNLSVLTRGSTLQDQVVLLGGPNTYLRFLQDCWRLRIPETWAERGHAQRFPLDQAIVVPPNAEYYAALGAAIYGLAEPVEVGLYRGREGLRLYSTTGRKQRLLASAGPPLAASVREVEEFTQLYTIPPFIARSVRRGEVVRAVIAIDGGSTSSKAVLVDEAGEIVAKAYALSKGNPIQDARELLASLRDDVAARGATIEVLGLGTTGYAANVLTECLAADVNLVETVAHMTSAVRYFSDVDVVCDIGGQDIKVLFLENGDIRNFRLSNGCSAGNGMLLQAMAEQFGLSIGDFAATAFAAELAPKFSYGCAVFLDTDRVNFQKEGFAKEELLAGLAQVLPKNVWQYVVQIPRLASLGRRFVLQGGTQKNLAAVKAQVDYIKERVPDATVFVHPHCGEAGALGAAFETLRVVKRRGKSTFIGLEQAIALTYTTTNDASTVCHFCPNDCKRTFVDTARPDGGTSRYIAGFSCEKGTVESHAAMLAIVEERRRVARAFPNLVAYEAHRAFVAVREPDPLPMDGLPIDDIEVKRGFFSVRRVRRVRGFRRSPAAAHSHRQNLRVGMPRVLNLYSTAPYFRAYFEALGMPGKNVVWSATTSEELWHEGGKYGSIDPCYPAKVAQAHIHDLLHHHGALDYIFFPILTHLPSSDHHATTSTSCPIVAGTPEVIRAAFTKEVDFFARSRVEYLAPALTFAELNLTARRMFETFGARLGITEDESDFAHAQGLLALTAFDRDLQDKGRAILEVVAEEGRIAILVVGRPYHSDPGLNHGLPEEFQALGYPILSIRSLPTDPEFLARIFRDEVARGQDPLDISDVWPESYSANSAAKVWAVKFAARHPNLAILDLSSFKCGHDAPTYGIIDSIVRAAGTPYAALHDLDANKPGGSLAIRVRTYDHSLKLRKEALDDLRMESHLEADLNQLLGELQARSGGPKPKPRRSLADEVTEPSPPASGLIQIRRPKPKEVCV